MAKVKFYCNSGANTREVIFDTVEDWGMEEGERESLLAGEKSELAEEWAHEALDIGYEEL